MRATNGYLLAERPDPKVAEKVLHHEKVTDAIQAEITIFLRSVQRARLTEEQSALAYAIVRAADELESIGDYCASVVRAYDRLKTSGETFSAEARADLRDYADGVLAYYAEIEEAVLERRPWDLRHFARRDAALTDQANRMRDAHRQRISANTCSPMASMSYSDIVVGLRKLKGHALNIAEAMAAG